MIRNFSTLVCFLFATLIFVSCQKEITYDLSLPSIGRLQCSRYQLNGIYMKGQAMDEFNSIIMRVKVTRRGTYHLESIGVENGIKFAGDGVFEEDGIQEVKLYATGTPIYSDTFTYKMTYNQDTCLVPVFFERPSNVVNAVMMFDGQPNTCNISPQDINGLYMVGLPMQSSNTVTVHATVSVPGTYLIETPIINGIKFRAQGDILTTGPLDIVLEASGTPINQNNSGAPYYYPITVGGNSCSVSLTFQPNVPPLTDIDIQCGSATISGSYIQGEPTNPSTHFVEIPVNFASGSTAGTYNITTQEINGVTFSGTGVLDPATSTSIILYASGTPTNGNPTPYTYSFNYTMNGTQQTCSFLVPVTGDYITAVVNGVFTSFNVEAGAYLTGNLGAPTLELNGRATSGPYPDLKIVLSLGPGASVNSGTFNVNIISTQGGNLTCTNNISNINFYQAKNIPGTTQLDPFTLTTAVGGSPLRIDGSFYGTLYYNGVFGQQPITLTDGVYSLPLQ